MDRNKLTRLRDWCEALLAADSAISEPEPEQPEPVDLDAWRISVRNRVLAGSGEKAALLGTLSTKPTVKAADIDAALGAGVSAERDRLRAAALARTAAEAEPKVLER